MKSKNRRNPLSIPIAVAAVALFACAAMFLRKPLYDYVARSGPPIHQVTTAPLVAENSIPNQLPAAETATTTGYTDPDLNAFASLPEISEYSVGSSTFSVIYWNKGGGLNAINVYVKVATNETNQPVLRHLYSDVGSSCSEPFEFGIKDGYFYVHKNDNPCEFMSEDWYRWYDGQGNLVVAYDALNSGGGSELSFQLKDGKSQKVELIYNKDCTSFPSSNIDFTQTPVQFPKIKLTGFKVGNRVVSIKPAKDMVCEFMEYNSVGYVDQAYYSQIEGTKVILTLPTEEKLSFDVRTPGEYELK